MKVQNSPSSSSHKKNVMKSLSLIDDQRHDDIEACPIAYRTYRKSKCRRLVFAPYHFRSIYIYLFA